jgi:hypothetical protein
MYSPRMEAMAPAPSGTRESAPPRCHLSRIYAKLEVTSRRQLTRLVTTAETHSSERFVAGLSGMYDR